MRKKKLLFLVILFLAGYSYAQTKVFMYNEDGTKEYFFVNNVVRYLQYDELSTPNLKSLYSIAQKVDTVMSGILKFTLKESDVEIFEKKVFSLNSIFYTKELVYVRDSTIQWCFNKILLQTKDNSELENILNTYEIPYLSYRTIGLAEHEYLVELSVSEALQYANLLYETGLFNYVVPSFYRTNMLNNPLYTSQWGLKNTGQNGGTVGIDINVEPAWNLSTGKGIVVAVVDNGVQLNHPDLAANLLPGYDAMGYGSDGGFSNSDYHGTCCAGIIAAEDNSIGVKGVAFEAKIVPIRAGLGRNMCDEAEINAFEYIYNQNIDVVSCSWGEGSVNPTLNNAINAVVTGGRNGLGCPVLFASGNDDRFVVSYPASLPSTIAVGALSPCGERKNPNSCDGENWGSNYGTALDVVAPGVLIPTTTISNDYEMYFKGTSAACPHAAGVMALILSANPCLTAAEARDILCKSCDKLTNYLYCENAGEMRNDETGYGKINAYKAVLMALGLSQELQGTGSFNNESTLNNWILTSSLCTGLASGYYYYVKRQVYTKTFSFPYIENPIFDISTNGYSAANPNPGNNFCIITNSTHKTITLKAFRYYLQYNGGGLTINQFLPNENVWFKCRIYDATVPNVVINGVNIVNNTYNRNATERLEVTNFSVQGSSNVSLRAGEEIILGNGTEIQIGTLGDFHAYIEPFVSCDDTRISSKFSSKEIKAYTSTNKSYNSENQENNIDFQADLSMTLYPNPAGLTFIISFTKTQENVKQVHIMDMMGKEVLKLENPSSNTVNIANLPAGMYVVRVHSQSGKIYSAKLVKE